MISLTLLKSIKVGKPTWSIPCTLFFLCIQADGKNSIFSVFIQDNTVFTFCLFYIFTFCQGCCLLFLNKDVITARVRIALEGMSKRVCQENRARQTFRKTNISYPLIFTEGKKCSFFGKFDVLSFLETPI